MQDSTRALQDLLHDLRTPLGVASGFVQLLHEGRLDTPEARERAWARTTAALSRMAEICQDAARHLSADEPTSLEPQP